MCLALEANCQMENMNLLEAPDWLIRVCKKREQQKRQSNVDIELDTQEAIYKVTQWLQTAAPSAVEGGGGDNTTYGVACWVKDQGISEHQCFELLADNWNADKAI